MLTIKVGMSEKVKKKEKSMIEPWFSHVPNRFTLIPALADDFNDNLCT